MRVRLALACALLAASANAEPTPAELERAKQLFRQGNALRKAGDCERALELFVRSRAIVASVPNVLNAAYCLNVLGRYDEALEHYEVLLTQFQSELRPEELEMITPAMADLRRRVGALQVSANVTGALLLVDGRSRGKLPLIAPVRVLPGTHRIVVIKDGYESFDAQRTAAAGKIENVYAELSPLRVAGRLRIDDRNLTGAQIVVDGAPVGVVPWQGVLAPGRHWLAVTLGPRGSAPAPLVIVEGQIAVVSPELRPLGPPLLIAVEPATAELSIDDVLVGRGSFAGRLPIGQHRVLVRAEGYFSERRRLEVTPAGPSRTVVRLRVDREHPRWGLAHGFFFVDALAGVAISPGLDSGVESSCDGPAQCGSSAPALGFFAGLRGGYEFPNRWSVQMLAGYLALDKDVDRRFTARIDTTPASYELSDRLSVSGPVIGAGIGYRLPLSELFDLRATLTAGALLATSRDDVDARARAEGSEASARVLRSGSRTTSASPFLMPELGLGLQVASFRAGFGLALPLFLLEGPDNAHGETVIDEPARCAEATVFCAQHQAFSVRERSHGRFFAVLPAVSAGLTF